jgi:cathepsin B
MHSGLVTAECYPYSIPTCPPEAQPCNTSTFVSTPSCTESCAGSSTSWDDSRHYLSSWYSVSSQVQAIQTEIMTNGPVEACFTVYQDFIHYKSGVYSHTKGPALGGHCIKLIGWGSQGTTPYWLAVNSWTTTWGDDGLFMILRGSDECGIESDVVAGTPDLSSI